MGFFRTLLFGLALLAGPAAQAQTPACTGKNVLDELRDNDQAAHARVMAAAANTENANSVLWKVEKAGVPPSHLFGTMHLTDARINALSPGVTNALGEASKLVLELEDISPGDFMKSLNSKPHILKLMYSSSTAIFIASQVTKCTGRQARVCCTEKKTCWRKCLRTWAAET